MHVFLGLSKDDLLKAIVDGQESTEFLLKEFPHLDETQGFSEQIVRYAKALESLELLP